jgi:hypothetical protein
MQRFYVFWCGVDETAALTDENVLLCATCHIMMEQIGWIEASE